MAFASDSLLVCDEPAATDERASDEHGRLGIRGATPWLNIGDKVRHTNGHKLYYWYICVRGGRVEQLWSITARDGCVVKRVRASRHIRSTADARQVGVWPNPVTSINRDRGRRTMARARYRGSNAEDMANGLQPRVCACAG